MRGKQTAAAGERCLDVIIDTGGAGHFGESRDRRRAQAADNADRRALDLGFDLARLLGAHDLDRHLERKFHVSDLGLERGAVSVRAGLGEVVHALDAGREQSRVVQRLVDFGARRLHHDRSGYFHCWLNSAFRICRSGAQRYKHILDVLIAILTVLAQGLTDNMFQLARHCLFFMNERRRI